MSSDRKKPKIAYPSPDGKIFAAADIEALRYFEATIRNSIVRILNNNLLLYGWEHDPAIEGQVHARLVRRRDKVQIISVRLTDIVRYREKKCEEKFLELLEEAGRRLYPTSTTKTT